MKHVVASRRKGQITMAKRQRSFSLSEPILDISQHRVLRNRGEGTEFKPYVEATFSAGDIRRRIVDLLYCCTPGVWLRILPLDDDDESLCFHTGQEWADVQPCLQECGLLSTPKHIGGKLEVRTKESEQFAGASAGSFEVGTARQLGGEESLFVMRKPMGKYKSPIDQLNDDMFEVQRATLSPSDEQPPHYF
jgi:hypothetical protein